MEPETNNDDKDDFFEVSWREICICLTQNWEMPTFIYACGCCYFSSYMNCGWCLQDLSTLLRKAKLYNSGKNGGLEREYKKKEEECSLSSLVNTFSDEFSRWVENDNCSVFNCWLTCLPLQSPSLALRGGKSML